MSYFEATRGRFSPPDGPKGPTWPGREGSDTYGHNFTSGGEPREIMTREQARGLVSAGIFDPDGMDPVVDQIFDEGITGVVRIDGELSLVIDTPTTL